MRLQRYHLLLVFLILLLNSCVVLKKKGCNDCPNFSEKKSDNSAVILL